MRDLQEKTNKIVGFNLYKVMCVSTMSSFLDFCENQSHSTRWDSNLDGCSAYQLDHRDCPVVNN